MAESDCPWPAESVNEENSVKVASSTRDQYYNTAAEESGGKRHETW